MDFITALSDVKQGGKITRTAWNDRNVYVCLQAGLLMIRLADGLFHSWLISEVDMYSRDWTTVADA